MALLETRTGEYNIEYNKYTYNNTKYIEFVKDLIISFLEMMERKFYNTNDVSATAHRHEGKKIINALAEMLDDKTISLGENADDFISDADDEDAYNEIVEAALKDLNRALDIVVKDVESVEDANERASERRFEENAGVYGEPDWKYDSYSDDKDDTGDY